jgi:hypothetical protein
MKAEGRIVELVEDPRIAAARRAASQRPDQPIPAIEVNADCLRAGQVVLAGRIPPWLWADPRRLRLSYVKDGRQQNRVVRVLGWSHDFIRDESTIRFVVRRHFVGKG